MIADNGQMKYTSMSSSTGEVALDITDQSFSGNLSTPSNTSLTSSDDGAFGTMIRKRGNFLICSL